MNNLHVVFMSDATGEAWVKYGRADTSARKAFSEFADRAYAEGIRWANFISPKTEGSLNTEESWAVILDWASKAHLTRQEVKYLDTPNEALNPGQREANAEAAKAKAEGKPPAPASGKTVEQKVIGHLNDALRLMREAEDIAFNPETPAEFIRQALTFIAKAGK